MGNRKYKLVVSSAAESKLSSPILSIKTPFSFHMDEVSSASQAEVGAAFDEESGEG